MVPGPTGCPPTGASAPAAASCPPSPPGRLAAAVAGASGNRCGHVPSAPRFDRINLPEDANHARPILIGQAMLKLKAYYDSPREARWDELSQGERHVRLERAIAAAGGPDTEEGRPLAARLARWRQQRSERREAVTTVLMLLLAYTDIDTLTVAIPSGGGWLGLSVAWIAERTGLSPSRVKRALATLNRAGLLTATGTGRRFDSRRRRWVGAGWGPVRRLSFQCVRMIGLEVSWQQEQRRRRKARVQQARAAAPPAPRPPAGSPAERRNRFARYASGSRRGWAARRTPRPRPPPSARPPSSAPAASPNWPPPASPPPKSASASTRPPSRPSPGPPRSPPLPASRRPSPAEPGCPAIAPTAWRARRDPRLEPHRPRFFPRRPPPSPAVPIPAPAIGPPRAPVQKLSVPVNHANTLIYKQFIPDPPPPHPPRFAPRTGPTGLSVPGRPVTCPDKVGLLLIGFLTKNERPQPEPTSPLNRK